MTAKPGPSNNHPLGAIETDPAARWRLTEELFHRAMECPAELRTQTLTEWCGPDTELLTAVLALVEADSCIEELISSASPPEASNYLEREPNYAPIRADDEPPDAPEAMPDPWLGRTLGAFRLERLLGRGGMGVVYLGERVTGGFAQRVAVKLVGRHLRSSPVEAQFMLERETLARLEHANIARLLDGGVTEHGFPYVVMEYVEGRRLDEACDDPATSIDQVIRWMLQLCSAVTYVHRNLILHRDLKPGNVMVTADGQVKLLDFGTLKRIGSGEIDAGLDSPMTQAGLRPVTVRYASPEHIETAMERATEFRAVSTATDVYSLGMMLYRLIAGRLPEELENLPIGEYVLRLRKGGFKPPSQVVQEIGSLKTDPKSALQLEVARDLDTIIAKALRYEPEARYPTVAALADDLTCLLTQRPVAARGDNLRYRAGKFYRRNRWPIAAAAAVLVVLASGLSGTAWQGHLAHLQQIRAETGIEIERKLIHRLLFDYFEKLALIPGSVDAQRRAATEGLTYLDSLSKIAPGSTLELDTIRGYTDMGNLLGNPYYANLGNVPEATITLKKGLAIAERRVHAHPHELDSLVELARVDLAIGGLYLGNGDAVQGERYLRTAADISAEMANSPHVDGPMLELAASVLDNLGDAYDPGRGFVTADLKKAKETYLLSDTYDEMCEQVDPKNGLCRFGLPVGQYKFGMLIEETDPALAASHYQQGLVSADQFTTEEKKAARTLRLHNYLSSRLSLMQIQTGNMADGEALARQVQQSFRDVIDQDKLNNRTRFDLVAFDTDLAATCYDYGKEIEAEQAVLEALDILKSLLSMTPHNVRWQMIQAQNWMTYGRIENKLGRQQIALDAERKGVAEAELLAQSKDASPEVLDDAAEDLLQTHFHPGDAQLALQFAQRAVNAYARPTPSQLLTLAKAQSAAGKAQDAAKTAQLAMSALDGPAKSKVIADEIAEAHKLAGR